jgi:hypothetical protein
MSVLVLLIAKCVYRRDDGYDYIGNDGVCFCLNVFEVYVDGSDDWCATMVPKTMVCGICAGIVDLGCSFMFLVMLAMLYFSGLIFSLLLAVAVVD